MPQFNGNKAVFRNPALGGSFDPKGQFRTFANLPISDSDTRDARTFSRPRWRDEAIERSATPDPGEVRPIAMLPPRRRASIVEARALSRAEICQWLAIGRVQLWRRISSGEFPEADTVVDGRPAWSVELVERLQAVRDTVMTRREVQSFLRIGRCQLWRRIRARRFPAADLMVAGCEAWSADLVRRWRDDVERLAHRALQARREAWQRASRASQAAHAKATAQARAARSWLDDRIARMLSRRTDRFHSQAEVYDQCDWCRDGPIAAGG